MRWRRAVSPLGRVAGADSGLDAAAGALTAGGGCPEGGDLALGCGCALGDVSTGGSGGEDRLTENVTLNFAKVKFSYAKQDSKGGVAADQDFAWNIAENHTA